MSDAIISVEGLGKRYRLGAGRSNERYTALRDVITEKARNLFRRRNRSGDVSVSASQNFSVFDAPTAREDFWALKEVSFEVKHGADLNYAPSQVKSRK